MIISQDVSMQLYGKGEIQINLGRITFSFSCTNILKSPTGKIEIFLNLIPSATHTSINPYLVNNLLYPASFCMQFISVSVVIIVYMLFSFFLLFCLAWYIPFLLGLFLSCFYFVMSSVIFQACHSGCVLLICVSFLFLDSFKPKGVHYPIYSCCFVMYESVANDVSLISIGALSFGIN